MLLFYVRHGDPIYSPDSLTELGHKQAEALVKRMKQCAPERIFASSSNRAILTATPSAQALGKEIEIMDWCHESHAWRDLTVVNEAGQRTWAFADPESVRFWASKEIRSLDRDWYKHPRYAGTSFETGFQRIEKETDNFLLSLGYRHDREQNGYIVENPQHERVALFAHQGFGLAFLSSLLDVPYPLFSTHFDMSHSNMTVIDFSPERTNPELVIPKVLQLSNDSHIYEAGIPTKYQNFLYF